MKKSIYLIILIVLVIIAGYFFLIRSTNTMLDEFNNFAIKDTSNIDRIFISNSKGKSILLTRESDNSWKINNNYTARKDGVDLLLSTFISIKVKEPVSKSTLETVIKTLATNSIKVEIYTGGDKPAKVYYVGNPTQNHFGTYMLLEIDGKKSALPYIMHMPGFHGFLTTRFFTDEDKWRDQTLFAYKVEEIKSIQLSYLKLPLKSFKITQDDHGFKVIDLSTGKDIEPVYIEAVDEYLRRFKHVYFEFVQRDTPLDNIDSVTSTLPLHIIEIEDMNGQKTTLKTYYKPVKDALAINPATGKAYTTDLDRLYVWLNDKDFLIMQWPSLDDILAYNSDFKRIEIVDN